MWQGKHRVEKDIGFDLRGGDKGSTRVSFSIIFWRGKKNTGSCLIDVYATQKKNSNKGAQGDGGGRGGELSSAGCRTFLRGEDKRSCVRAAPGHPPQFSGRNFSFLFPN